MIFDTSKTIVRLCLCLAILGFSSTALARDPVTVEGPFELIIVLGPNGKSMGYIKVDEAEACVPETGDPCYKTVYYKVTNQTGNAMGILEANIGVAEGDKVTKKMLKDIKDWTVGDLGTAEQRTIPAGESVMVAVTFEPDDEGFSDASLGIVLKYWSAAQKWAKWTAVADLDGYGKDCTREAVKPSPGMPGGKPEGDEKPDDE